MKEFLPSLACRQVCGIIFLMNMEGSSPLEAMPSLDNVQSECTMSHLEQQ